MEEITNITFFVYKIRDHPIGAPCHLPAYITENRAVISLLKDPNTQKPYRDNLCLFRCLALHKGEHRKALERKTKSLYREYTKQPLENFKGITLEQLSDIENKFGVNITVYELVQPSEDDEQWQEEEYEETDDKKIVARLVRRSANKHDEAMYLNLHSSNEQLHFSYISNVNLYSKSYSCRKCHKLWKTGKQLHRHEATCECQGK